MRIARRIHPCILIVGALVALLHNMTLMSPITTVADMDHHAKLFGLAADGLAVR